jgi:hypothetical protein
LIVLIKIYNALLVRNVVRIDVVEILDASLIFKLGKKIKMDSATKDVSAQNSCVILILFQ